MKSHTLYTTAPTTSLILANAVGFEYHLDSIIIVILNTFLGQSYFYLLIFKHVLDYNSNQVHNQKSNCSFKKLISREFTVVCGKSSLGKINLGTVK